MIHPRAFARAGLIGNPSDGYFGKTISVILRNFSARVVCYESPRIQIGSRQLGDNWFHVDGVQRKLRNEIMGTMTAEDYYYQLNWLYGHNEAKRAA